MGNNTRSFTYNLSFDHLAKHELMPAGPLLDSSLRNTFARLIIGYRPHLLL
jgi:hypothetical protein